MTNEPNEQYRINLFKERQSKSNIITDPEEIRKLDEQLKKEYYEKLKSQAEAKKKEKQTIQPIQQNPNVAEKENMIYIPTANIYFAKQRTHLNKNWSQTHDLLNSEGLRMPTIEEFRKTLSYLKNSSQSEHLTLYNEITEVRFPWRANWLDAYFEKRKNGLYLLTANKTKEEKLEDCLMTDKTPGILLEDWLNGKNITSQGLPELNMVNGELYYWYPRDGRVARFYAYSDGAYLSCSWDPANRYSVLGVFGIGDAG